MRAKPTNWWCLAAMCLAQQLLVHATRLSSVPKNLIVDTDLFSDVEYISTYSLLSHGSGSVG